MYDCQKFQVFIKSSSLAGHEWHPRIRSEQNHFICNDLPRFIMDSYEECRDPPRLNLLDKYGSGLCFQRNDWYWPIIDQFILINILLLYLSDLTLMVRALV